MLNRRQAVQATLTGAVAALRSGPLFAQAAGPSEIWVNPAGGADTNSGAKASPLRTVAEAARRINQSTGEGSATIVLTEGIHAIGETTVLKPERRSLTRTGRLTIRAEVLPDDADWHTGRMPTLIHTMPLPKTWNGRPDPLGGAADGLMVETSHVTIQGLKILGLPVVETPKPGLIQRLYAVSRLRRDLEDLEIAQCVFLGDDLTNPNHVAIIANGNGVNVHHCIFRGLKISVVFWTGGSSGHAMRNCFCDGVYGSGVWTAGIKNDFEYRNNVIANGNYAWTYQGGASAQADAGGRGGRQGAAPAPATPRELVRYNVIDSYFANNRRIAGSGTGARLDYQDMDASFLEMAGTKVTAEPVIIERDQTKRSYLHPVAGSEAAKVGAGLFLKPLA
jgi:predicted alpha/beta-hydrolase family hydrolase